MRIRVLTVPDCPNAPVIEERIARALGRFFWITERTR